MTKDWFANDELFRRLLEEGHRQAEFVAQRLRERSILVRVTPLEWRLGVEQRRDFVDEYDLTVGTARPCRIDVKSRNLEFSSPADYPF